MYNNLILIDTTHLPVSLEKRLSEGRKKERTNEHTLIHPKETINMLGKPPILFLY